MTVIYHPERVCSRKIIVSAENGFITDVKIIGGCIGNTQGICRLLTGMKVEDAISRLSGIDCGGKGTSCPDQLSIALQRLYQNDPSDYQS